MRPKTFDEFIGKANKNTVEKIKIVVKAAQMRKKTPGHILLYGNAGTGKTTIANIIASELGYKLKTITGGTIKSQMDLYRILCEVDIEQGRGGNLTLFIDEIHRLSTADMPEEMWFPILEDFTFYNNLRGRTILLDEGEFTITSSKVFVEPFLVIGATTAPGELSNALRTRFALHCSLKEYTDDDLRDILLSYSKKEGVTITRNACLEIAKRGRGNPRMTLNLLRLIKDKALVENKNRINSEFAVSFLCFLNLDETGLTENDCHVLRVLAMNEKGMGINNLSGTSGIERSVLEEIILPFLQYKGLAKTTHRRFITEKGKEYLNKTEREKKMQEVVMGDITKFL